MRSLFTLLFLLAFSVISSGNTYYMATTGSNSNSGSINSPWLTIEHATSQMVAGDTLYLRGGTYRSTKPISTVNRFYIQNLIGTATNRFYIFNYPGERPIFNMNEQLIPGSPGDGPVGLKVENCRYVHIKGIRVTGISQNPNGSNTPAGMILFNVDNSTIEQVEIDNVEGYGMYLQGGSDNNLIKNCDAHHLIDTYTGLGGANGFNITGGDGSTNNVFDGCRAWWISDDGFDLYGTNSYATYRNCWAFWNGYYPGTFTPAGDGMGFKLGPTATNQSGTTLRVLENCLAFENRLNGFDQNSQSNTTCRITMLNCAAVNNGSNGYFFGANLSTQHTFRNNLNFGNGIWGDEIQAASSTVSHNTWNGGVTLTSADFVSLSSAGVDGPRQADGSLPNLNFLKLASGSDLIDAGINVGLPYSGNAPERGAYEFGTAPPVNQAPTANAGNNQTITLPTNNVTVNGSGTDPDGSIASYLWTKLSGPATFTIVSPAQAQTVINNLVQGTYQFELRVTDNQGAIGRDTMTVTVNAAPNQAPTANAGPNQTITLPTNTVTVTGSGTDPDGTIASYLWTKISGPTSFTIVSPSQAQTVINNLVQGTYQFALRVTDNGGAIGRDTMTVIVNAAPNQAPVASAGPDLNITLPTSTVTLNGSGTDPDGTIASYLWTKIAGPTSFTIVSPSQNQTVINTLVQGVYQFELRVTDNQGAIGRDTVTVTVNAAPNQAPAANAGANQTITLPTNSVTLTGSGTDPDGTITSYLWTKISGPTTFTIVSPNTAQTVINNLVQGTYVFRLTVTDNSGATADAFVTVTVNSSGNQAPVANAGPDIIITLPTNTTTLNGSGTDADGTIASYQWTKISGPATFNIVSPTQAQTVINTLVQGSYVFSLTVTDNSGNTGIDYVTITVNAPVNQLPAATVGPDQTLTLPTNNTTLTGNGTDPDGTIVSYQWTKISGPATFTIATPTQAQTIINNLVQGTYVFRFTVTDNNGGTADAFVTIIVNPAPNQLPTANAGPDQTITLPTNSVTLTGSGTDPDGSIASYQWTKISGPTTFTIVSPNAAQTAINNLVQGTYVFRLRVTDNGGATADAFVTITVNPPVNQPPVANAGTDQTLVLPTNSTTLTGTGTDPDGTVVSYLWDKIAGPAQFVILSPTQPQTIINNLVQGVYQFELRVTDNLGAIDRDTVVISVSPAPPPNQAPTANAGPDQIITLPTNSLTATGTGTDPDGSIASYQWTKISGPATFNIVSPTQAQTVINNLVQGTYQFELRVTDNQGATGRDTMTVTVNPAPPVNQAPIANAGNNQTITLPVNSVTINGSGTDPDGTVVSYQWTRISGPTTYIIVFPTQAQTVINNLVQGTYQFELRVTDNLGAVGRDTITITVNAVPNQLPIANAGPDRSMTLPTNSITHTGSGTDPDGTIVSYQWTKVAGPSQYIIETPAAAQTVFSNLTEGIYLFELLVTDNLGGTDTDTVSVEVKADITLLRQAYPNPATDNITVRIDPNGNARSSLVLTVYDFRGVSVYSKQLGIGQQIISEQINLEKFPRGMYVIEVVADKNKKATFQFVKQ